MDSYSLWFGLHGLVTDWVELEQGGTEDLDLDLLGKGLEESLSMDKSFNFRFSETDIVSWSTFDVVDVEDLMEFDSIIGSVVLLTLASLSSINLLCTSKIHSLLYWIKGVLTWYFFSLMLNSFY